MLTRFTGILLILFAYVGCIPANAEDLRSVLLDQLHSTHDRKDWFVPLDVAVADLTPAQASWTDGKGNHSVGQLTNHLLFWNRRELEKLTGKKSGSFNGKNDETFNDFDAKSWAKTVSELDEVLTGLEKLVETADKRKLEAVAQDVAHISTHNAYHIGQIVFVRKEQGVWDAAKGVK